MVNGDDTRSVMKDVSDKDKDEDYSKLGERKLFVSDEMKKRHFVADKVMCDSKVNDDGEASPVSSLESH